MTKIATLEDYLKTLVGCRVGVTIKSYKNDILGQLDCVTYDGAECTGIIVDKWGWINKSEIKRINKAVSRNGGNEE
jgi:hypothetical protein